MMTIAHGGASGSAPGNTLAAFRRAIDDGAGWLELDVRATKDGEIVVFHDDTLDRTTEGTGRVETRTLAELRRLDAGTFFHRRFAGEKIPTLREVLRLARRKSVGLFIEMKPGSHLDGRWERKLVAMLRRERMVDRSFVMSFDHDTVGRVKRAEPRLRCLVLIGSRMSRAALVRTVQLRRADGASFGSRFLNRMIVSEFHRRGWIAVVWTVNDVSDIQKFRRMGVDGITTDFPSRLVKLLRGGRAHLTALS